MNTPTRPAQPADLEAPRPGTLGLPRLDKLPRIIGSDEPFAEGLSVFVPEMLTDGRRALAEWTVDIRTDDGRPSSWGERLEAVRVDSAEVPRELLAEGAEERAALAVDHCWEDLEREWRTP